MMRNSRYKAEQEVLEAFQHLSVYGYEHVKAIFGDGWPYQQRKHLYFED